VPTVHQALPAFLGPSLGQGWREIGYLVAAFVLCSLIGLERQVRRKSAGLRTHALVGLGAALFVLISKYAFMNVIGPHVVLDPSRVAAQIVSGIGFIGAGLIFVRRDSVRGLTTAAVVWVTAAVGAACGGGLVLLATVVTAAHYLTVVAFPFIIRRLPGVATHQTPLAVRYLDGRAVLRQILATTTAQGFTVAEVETHSTRARDEDQERVVDMELHVDGRGPLELLLSALAQLDGVVDVSRAVSEE
jgi:putative Mg2+ transporter-C (MgtC) family protein